VERSVGRAQRAWVEEIGLWVSDGNQAMLNAITKKFPASARQRCIMHKMIMCSVTFPQTAGQIKPELRALFYQKDRAAADQAVAAFIEKYRSVYPTAIACLQRDLEACLTFYAFPKEHWKTIRTNNVMWSGLFGEVKRRSHKMAAAFRNEESCLLLFYAVIRSLKFNKLTMPVTSQAQPDSAVLHTTLDILPIYRNAYISPDQISVLKVQRISTDVFPNKKWFMISAFSGSSVISFIASGSVNNESFV